MEKNKKFFEYVVEGKKFNTFGDYLNGIVESYQKLELKEPNKNEAKKDKKTEVV